MTSRAKAIFRVYQASQGLEALPPAKPDAPLVAGVYKPTLAQLEQAQLLAEMKVSGEWVPLFKTQPAYKQRQARYSGRPDSSPAQRDGPAAEGAATDATADGSADPAAHASTHAGYVRRGEVCKLAGWLVTGSREEANITNAPAHVRVRG